MSNDQDGQLWVISAPSGAGKTTLINRLLEAEGGVGFSVSHTTRPPRAGEQDTVAYHFVQQERFDQMVQQGEFLEWARVHAACYGTSRQAVKDAMSRGHQVLLDIDVQGGQQVLDKMAKARLIFVLPPSWNDLKKRLHGRARGEDEAELTLRLTNAQGEVEAARGVYQWVLINDDKDMAFAQLEDMILGRQPWPGPEGAKKAKLALDQFLNSGTMND